MPKVSRGGKNNAGTSGKYTQDKIKSAIEKFTSDQYDKIRRASRGEKVTYNKFDLSTKTTKEVDVTDKYKNEAKAIEQYINEKPITNQKLYRGITVDDSTLASYKVGQTIDQKGLSSWTTDKKTAGNFGKQNNKTPNKVIFVEKNGTKKVET